MCISTFYDKRSDGGVGRAFVQTVGLMIPDESEPCQAVPDTLTYLLHFLVSAYCLIGAELKHKDGSDVTTKPYQLTFKNGHTLNVEVQIQNLWKLYKRKDINYSLYLRDTLLAPPSTTKDKEIIIKKNLADSWAGSSITLCLSSENDSACDVYESNIIDLKYSENAEDGQCLGMEPCVLKIKLDKKLKLQENLPTAADIPQIKTEARVPHGNPREDYITIECTSRVQDYDLLLLYQEQEEDHPQLLKMEQHLSKKRKTNEMTLRFNKTLQDLDKKNKVFCARQTIADPIHEVRSHAILLYEDDFGHFFAPPRKGKVTVNPTSGGFELNSVSFVCNGTPPEEGRGLHWYIQDKNTSEIQAVDTRNQSYNPNNNENRLTLLLDDRFRFKTLFCAEDFYINVEYPNKTVSLRRYGVRATSETIELELQREKSWGLIWGLVVGTAVILSAVAAAFAIRAWRRRSGRTNNDNEDNYEYAYVTPQVRYAELDLQRPSAAHRALTAKTVYANIVGVYNPRK